MRLIDADALKLCVQLEIDEARKIKVSASVLVILDRFINSINAQPTIEERKAGKWEIYVISPFDGEGCRCSECKYEGAPYWDFCPNCGCFNGENNNGNE